MAQCEMYMDFYVIFLKNVILFSIDNIVKILFNEIRNTIFINFYFYIFYWRLSNIWEHKRHCVNF